MTVIEISSRILWKTSLILGKMTLRLAVINATRKHFDVKPEIRVAFFPYSTNDCRTLHEIFAKQIAYKHGVQCDVVKSNIYGKNVVNIHSAPLSYESKITGLKEYERGNEIWRGMADDYRKKCGVSEFFDHSPYNENVIGQIEFSYLKALELIEKYDIFFLTDLAYTFSRTIHFLAKQKNKSVYILNPHGQLLNVSSKSRYPSQNNTIAEFDTDLHLITNDLRQQLLKSSEKYFANRIKGTIKSDREALRAYNSFTSSNISNSCNILMLHCIRDASRDLPSKEQKYDLESDDYFIWTKKMFSQITNQQEKWKIKIHPSSAQYPGETEIIDRLAEDFQIKASCFQDVPATSDIIANQMPVFTYSGTIALETAAAGFKSYVFGTTYPEWIAKRIELGNLDKYVNASPSRLSSEETANALILLYLNAKQNRSIYSLCPEMAVGPSTNKLMRSRSELKSSLSFLVRYSNKKTRKELGFIIEQLGAEIIGKKPMSISLINRLKS